MNAIDVVILAAATWRLASLFATEEGPYGMFDKIRAWAGVEFDGKYMNPTTPLARGLLCPSCNSVWIGVYLASLYKAFPSIALWLALPLALSALALLLNRFIRE